MIRHAARKNELGEDDIQAVSDAGTSIMHVIQETTRWPIADLLNSRWDEYDDRNSTRNPIEAFSGVLLHSMGKKSIHDPDHRTLPPDISDTPLIIRTMIHLTSHIPAYLEMYKNIVAAASMD